jgi:hypothetical protein
MGTQCLGYSWATLFPRVINTETWSSRLGFGRWTNKPRKKVIVKKTQNGEARARLNRDYFCKQHQPDEFCNGELFCFL